MSVKVYRDADLYKSEPDPRKFGNPANEPDNKVWTNSNWLKSRFHFSFAEYYDSKRSNFGVLRVVNDDLVQASRGFGTHGHSDMEIATYIVSGSLTHQDSMGTRETLSRGGVQYMSAGTGVRHSEFNEQKDSDLRFIQMWIEPRTRHLKPNYGGFPGHAPSRKNAWQHLVSDNQNKEAATPVKIEQDANIFVTELDEGKSLPFVVAAGRQAYVLCLEGAVEMNGEHGKEALVKFDGAEVLGANSLGFSAKGPVHLLIVEMKLPSK